MKIKIISVIVIAFLLFLLSCEIHNPGIPNWDVEYGFQIIDDTIDVAKDIAETSESFVKQDDKLLFKNSSKNNILMDLTLKNSRVSLSHKRKSEIKFSKIDNRNFKFLLKELDEMFYQLDQYPGNFTFNVDSFKNFSSSKATNETNENYNEFESVKIINSRLRVTVKNNSGIKLGTVDSPIRVTLKDEDRKSLNIPTSIFNFGTLVNGADSSILYYFGSTSTPKDFYKVLMVEVSGKNASTGATTLNKDNNLLVTVGFDTVPAFESFQIQASEYTAESVKSKTINQSSNKLPLTIDNNNNNKNDVSLYFGKFSLNDKNKLDIKVDLRSKSAVELKISFPEINSGFSTTDTLVKYFYIPELKEGQTSRIDSLSINLSGFNIGEKYVNENSKIYDSVSINLLSTFSDPDFYTTVSIFDYVNYDISLDSSEFELIHILVKEDLNVNSIKDELSVESKLISIRDKNGKEVDSVQIVGSSTTKMKFKNIIASLFLKGLYNEKNGLIEVSNEYSAKNPNNEKVIRKINSTNKINITSTLLETIEQEIGKSGDIPYLYGVLPDKIDYTQKITLKKSDIPLEILASTPINLQVDIISDFIIDSQDSTLYFVVNKETEKKGVFSEAITIMDGTISRSQLDNYLEGNMVLRYSNKTKTDANVQIIISSDSSSVYKSNIETDGEINTFGTTGYPSYVARVIEVNGLLAGKINETKRIPLSKSDIEPLVFDKVYSGIILPLKGKTIDFSGQIEVIGKIELKIKVDEKIY